MEKEYKKVELITGNIASPPKEKRRNLTAMDLIKVVFRAIVMALISLGLITIANQFFFKEEDKNHSSNGSKSGATDTIFIEREPQKLQMDSQNLLTVDKNVDMVTTDIDLYYLRNYNEAEQKELEERLYAIYKIKGLSKQQNARLLLYTRTLKQKRLNHTPKVTDTQRTFDTLKNLPLKNTLDSVNK